LLRLHLQTADEWRLHLLLDCRQGLFGDGAGDLQMSLLLLRDWLRMCRVPRQHASLQLLLLARRITDGMQDEPWPKAEVRLFLLVESERPGADSSLRSLGD